MSTENNKWAVITLVLIVCVGGFFRSYNLDSWMHYELDQARDFRVISAAYEKGIGELPLQGPKAAGNVFIDSDGDGVSEDKTTLRLGPLFYYIEYLSAVIFGATPGESVMLITLLSIATIPLFYFFAREFFQSRLALALTALLATSLYFVVYSRFGWNPNLIPFFSLASAYCLLQTSQTKLAKSDRGRWLVGASASFAFLSNMHFLAFTVFPVICVAYLLWTRPAVPWKYWILAVVTFCVLNTPLVINDIKTGGENYKAFIASVRGDATQESASLGVNILRNAAEHTEMAWVVLTGDQKIKTPKPSKDGTIACDELCKKSLAKSLATVGYLFGGWISWLIALKNAKTRRQKNFLRMTGLWGLVTFVIYTPLAFDFAPRFFLLQAPIFIIFLGLITQGVMDTQRPRLVIAVKVVLLITILGNAYFVAAHFKERSIAGNDTTFRLVPSDLILKEKTRVNLGQMEEVVDAMVDEHTQNGEMIFMEAQAELKRAFWERIESNDFYSVGKVGDLRTQYLGGNYYIVVRTQSDFQRYFEKFEPYYIIQNVETFGTLTLYTLKVRNSEGLVALPDIEDSPDPQFSSSAQVRYLWRQVFQGCTYDYTTRRCEMGK